MKFSLYVTLFAVLMLTGCDRSVDNDIVADIATCELYHSISYPGVWQFRMHEFSGKDVPSHVQFVDGNLGFVSGNNTDYNQAYAWKTADGGLTWEAYSTSFHEEATSFWFHNEGIAYVGVAQQPGGMSRMARTGDGGLNWMVQEYESLSGNFIDLYFKNEEQGYALLQANDSTEKISLLMTVNGGQSWDEVFEDGSLLLDNTRLNMSFTQDFIYLAGAGGNIYMLDHQGEMVSIIQGPETDVQQFQIIDDGVLYVVGQNGLWLSEDAGITWQQILVGDIRIGAFFDDQAGLIVHNHNYCESNVYHAHDALTATTDGGDSWIGGTLTSNLLIDHTYSQKITNNLSVHLFKNRLVFCER